jgi:YHS domain-containing protein
MMARLIVLALIGLVIYTAVKVILGLWWFSREKARRRAGTERQGGPMVLDPQCSTYIPKDRAIQVWIGKEQRYFCSDACAQAFREKQATA